MLKKQLQYLLGYVRNFGFENFYFYSKVPVPKQWCLKLLFLYKFVQTIEPLKCFFLRNIPTIKNISKNNNS